MCFERADIEHALDLELVGLANRCYCGEVTGMAHNTWAI